MCEINDRQLEDRTHPRETGRADAGTKTTVRPQGLGHATPPKDCSRRVEVSVTLNACDRTDKRTHINPGAVIAKRM